ncbi:MAG: chorismate mutase [Bacteroidales bacterium]|nr:chorismate mutase [Bacteroidales bacterium]
MKTLEEIRARIDEVDERMAELFAERMKLVREAAEYKRAAGLPVEDKEREKEILARHGERFSDDPKLRSEYERFQKTVIQISKDDQAR